MSDAMDDRATVTTDVLVVGGGTGGVLAALGAAEEGARVVLVDADTALGGVGVRAGIHLYYVGSKGGTQDRLDRRTREVHKQFGGKARGFHPEAKWVAVDERLRSAGVEVVLNAIVVAVLREGTTVVGAVLETENERIVVRAHVVVDATGGGDVAALAGAEYEIGRDWDAAQHTYSMVPRHFDPERRVLHYKNYDVGWVDSTDVRDVSRGYRDGRRFAWRDDESPQTDHYLALGPQLGIREGRRIMGDHVLTQDDLLLDRRFDDLVARVYSHHDTHTLDYANESAESQEWIPIYAQRMMLFAGGVPYRTLLPRGLDGILVGCRALSQTHDASMHLRMQRDMQKVGEAAGVAAALAVRSAVAPRAVDTGKLQRMLVARGVLKETDLHRESLPAVQSRSFDTPMRMLPRPDVPDEEPMLDALSQLFGTPEEWVAQWWVARLGADAVEHMVPLLGADVDPRVRRGAAIGIGLAGDPRAIPELVATVHRRDSDRPSDDLDLDRAEQRWIAALIVLRELGDATVAPDVIGAVRDAATAPDAASTQTLYFLHYLREVADQLGEAERRAAVAATRALLERPDLGADFFVQGSHDATGTRSDASSMRWGLELAAAALLASCGAVEEAEGIFERYDADPRGFARAASARIRWRLAHSQLTDRPPADPRSTESRPAHARPALKETV